MSIKCIYNIDIATSNNDIISISSDYFKNFYISNIDENGDEISYNFNFESKNLYADFFMVKILNDKSPSCVELIDRLYNLQDIIKLRVCFTNGTNQEFDLAKKRVIKNGKLINLYEEAFIDEDDLCIVISDRDIKYKKNLFA